MDQEQKKLAEELLFSKVMKRSFSKNFFFGIFDSTAFQFPENAFKKDPETEELLSKLRKFADENIDPKKIDHDQKISEKVIHGLGELGILGMTVPKEYGGLGMSQHAYCQVIEEIASRCGSTAVFTNAHQSIGLKGILLFGTKEQKDRYLPELAKGSKISAFSLTEPNAGSDAAGIETTAVYDAEKKVFRINGKKQWTTNGSIANILTVMAKTVVMTKEGLQQKVTAFLVDPSSVGFKIINPALEKVGIRGTQTANLEFTNLEVPEENLLGPLGGGLRVCLTCLDYGRTTFGAMCTGAAKYAVKRAIDHAKSRYQFNQPLASFELVKEKLATMSALTYAMDATTYFTAGLMDKGEEDVMLEAAILKVFASDSLWNILYDTMQIFGGLSFFTSESLERMMRDARLNMIGEGSNEVLRAFIGLVGMRDVGMKLKGTGKDFKSIIAFVIEILKKVTPPQITVKSKTLKEEANFLGKGIRNFNFDIIKILAKYKEEIVEKQLILNRITNCAIALYTMTAVISKLDKELDIDPNTNTEVGKLYCKMAMQNIYNNRFNITQNYDEAILSTANTITGL